jgi:predicted ATPase/DNA-binding SARP family transcriptional activator/tetratricopeptide (TPR) repeat protein
MAVLKLSLLGPFTAALDDTPFDHFSTHKVQALLIYLAVEKDCVHPRQGLMELLWPGMPLESAQVNLRQTIYRLRKALPEVDKRSGCEAVPLILSDRQVVQLNPEGEVYVDVNEFRKLITVDPAAAVKLYRGDFLTDFYLVDSSMFEAWAESHRESARRDVLEILNRITQRALHSGNHQQAQAYAWRQLEIDSLRESAYCQLMMALMGNGQRSAALAQYQVCRRRLLRELGLEPSPETTALYKLIQADTLSTPTPRPKSRSGDMVVFMLTDIEESTRLWDKHRQAMLPALLTHNQILEEQINRHGGKILELRGDGVKAVFEGVNPLPCALDIQKGFGAVDWGEIGDLRIRIGLHGVKPVHKDFDYFVEDDHYYGPVLNYTARIMDVGHGGQILASEQVHNTYSLPQGASWQDHGLHRVKGLKQPLQIYGLLHPDNLFQPFPPLRSRSTPSEDTMKDLFVIRHNLVPQITAFIGRQDELGKLDGMLADPDTRLITITGPGGIGKTRLAIACAERQISNHYGDNGHFQDGIFFVSLADIDIPDHVPFNITKALNLPFSTGDKLENVQETIQGQLLDHLHRKQILLVLDNFEQILEGGRFLLEVLQTAPEVKILVTSRERLHLLGEQIFPIQGLEFPNRETPKDPGDYTAMQLFLECAKRVRPDFEIKTSDMADLTHICRLVGGMPLGLELAAAWVNMMPVKDIAMEIQRGIDFLETDIRNLPTRHRSLRAVCDSTWKRLNSTEQDIFARLSVFRGGFTLESARLVTKASIRSLVNLGNKSLIHYDSAKERYFIHPYLRRYGIEQLQTCSERYFETQERHASFYCALVDENRKIYEWGTTEDSINRIDDDIVNIRRAWDWAISQKSITLIEQSIQGLCYYFQKNRRTLESLEICRDANQTLSDMVSIEGPDEHLYPNLQKINKIRAKALNIEGYLNLDYCPEQAAKKLKESRQIIDELKKQGEEVRMEEAQLLCYQGILHQDYAKAKELLLESISLAQEIKDNYRIFFCFRFLGYSAQFAGLKEESKSWNEQGLALVKAHHRPLPEAQFLLNLGNISRDLRDYQKAIQYFEKALIHAKAFQSNEILVFSNYSLGCLLLFLGHLEQAETKFHKAILHAKESGFPIGFYPRATLCVTEWLQGKFIDAENSILTSIDMMMDQNFDPSFYSHLCHIELLLLSGRYEMAVEKYKRKDEWSRGFKITLNYDLGRKSRILSLIRLVEKDYALAREQLHESIKHYRAEPDEESIAWSEAFLALTEYHLGYHSKGKEILERALSTAIEIQGYIPMVFALPISLVFLENEDINLVKAIFQVVRRDPFLGKAPFWDDLVYQSLANEIKRIPTETVETNPDHRDNLWAAARQVLSALTIEGE